ncbi:2-oxoglutarate and iron-dependent oxygenase domain-containing protein 3 isoform X2 [Pongo pygmaeus]|uniref:2-oxoglutarate and iron-dependent oxygenase domain-containing protein 3 isoform X2 n=1 Tax=Pongo pygmaeus TaxID=9600 RepID=UPI0023E12C3D|nr:2-oxoglutarate and iron-dependent oxygenase domain-containing protein 3 isoform X2 [Pongo pygmaeus]XP_054312238.1 2-oxoglutarate and iron-dependent oxygenase domain-containing protein 3 isoform X2 [Pongo pygmaeus]
MAPQRRAATKAPEGNGAAERRNRSSTKKDRAPREVQRLWQRPWLRTAGLGAGLVLTALLLWSSLGADDGVAEVLARRGEVVAGRFIEVPCSEDYDSHRRFEGVLAGSGPDSLEGHAPVALETASHLGCPLTGCTPRKCGRGVTDVVITREEAERIRSIAEKGLSLGGSDGGASILDLHSGALSVGKHFVNLYRYFGDKIQNIFSEEDFQLYREVRQKVQLTIAEAFGISASSLHLTKPTFFSRINSTEARTAHDEYWHAHVDKVTYGSFDYTSLLYLSDYLEDFGGGRFVFMEEGANKTVEPRAGRVSFFTSGSENLHRVEKVHWGTRYAITIAFSCNPDHGIEDPAFL